MGAVAAIVIFIFAAISILAGFTIHEFTHAYVADRFGDDTPRLMGRLTLNPLAHLDLFGTIFLLLAGFGWGKPVIVNPRNFKNPVLDNVTVSLAGPMSNLALAVIAGLFYRFLPLPSLLQVFVQIFIEFNLVLMIFNFIPIPPLDGSKILSLFLPEEIYLQFQQMGMFLLFGLILLSSFIPIIPTILSKGVGFFFTLITGTSTSF
jgi:Zn-dependent protease